MRHLIFWFTTLRINPVFPVSKSLFLLSDSQNREALKWLSECPSALHSGCSVCPPVPWLLLLFWTCTGPVPWTVAAPSKPFQAKSLTWLSDWHPNKGRQYDRKIHAFVLERTTPLASLLWHRSDLGGTQNFSLNFTFVFKSHLTKFPTQEKRRRKIIYFFRTVYIWLMRKNKC